jgi:hypothetical protein
MWAKVIVDVINSALLMPQRLIDLCNIALFSSVDNLAAYAQVGIRSIENNAIPLVKILFSNVTPKT